MYVVRRSFRNYNKMVVPGSIVEPDTIKRFKARLRDRSIVEVSAQNIDDWNDYFVGKFGVSIKPKQEKQPVVAQAPAKNTDEKRAAASTKRVVKAQ